MKTICTSRQPEPARCCKTAATALSLFFKLLKPCSPASLYLHHSDAHHGQLLHVIAWPQCYCMATVLGRQMATEPQTYMTRLLHCLQQCPRSSSRPPSCQRTSLHGQKARHGNTSYLCSSIHIALFCPGASTPQACISPLIFARTPEQSFSTGMGPPDT